MEVNETIRVLKKKQSRLTKRYRRKIKRLQRQVNFFNKKHIKRRSIMSGWCFWKNYINVFNWRKNCFDNLNNLHYSLNGVAYTDYYNFHQHTFENEYFGSIPEIIVDSQTSSTFQDCSIESEINDLCDSEEESTDEYTVTKEYMEYLEISMRHKEALRLEKEKRKLEEMKFDNKKAYENRTKSTEKKSSERGNIEECQAPNERCLEALRMEEMRELYGDASPMILGMETAMQLLFNRNCDMLKPTFWPYLPLNLKFE